LRERPELARDLEQRLFVHVAQHRHDQPALGGHGDAEVHVALDDELPGRRVERGVERRMVAERQRGRFQEEGRERQRDAARSGLVEAPRDDRIELGDVGTVEVGDVRDHRRGQRHALGDGAA
jgi:hypothetical protein